jgi:YD repeat-containing protein
MDYGTYETVGEQKMKYFAAILIAMMITSAAGAQEMRFYNDAQGRPQGSATRFGDMTFYNDAQGRPVGSATQFGNQTFYNDSMGRPMGSATDFGGE